MYRLIPKSIYDNSRLRLSLNFKKSPDWHFVYQFFSLFYSSLLKTISYYLASQSLLSEQQRSRITENVLEIARNVKCQSGDFLIVLEKSIHDDELR